MDWKRDNYYTTRAGEKVRLICTNKAGSYPLVFSDEIGQIFTATAKGRHMDVGVPTDGDITGPWVEPAKPLELWANEYANYVSTWDSEAAAARHVDTNPIRIAVHMREVVP